MQKLLAAVALSALLTAPALGADLRRPMPVKAPPAPVVTAYSWTGCYLGAQIGLQWGRDHTAEFTDAGVFNNFDERFDSSGFIGGGHLGCNWQTSNIVFGIEGDFEGSTVDGGYTLTNGNGTDFDLRWQASIRGRLGVAFDRVLIYVTGGAAFADLRYAYFTAAGVREQFSDTRTGWTVGGGVEWAMFGNWSARGEYRFTDFGDLTNNSAVAFPAFTYKHDPQFHAVRGYLTYRFGGGAPVVARY